MMGSEQILSQIRRRKGVLIGRSMIEQLQTSLYIFDDLLEVMATAREVSPSPPHMEVIGVYSEAVPVSLKVQALADGNLLVAGIHEVHGRQGIGQNEFEWHGCESNLEPAKGPVSFATADGETVVPNVSILNCADCGYVAFTLQEAQRVFESLEEQTDPGLGDLLNIARELKNRE